MLKIALCDDQSPFHETMQNLLERELQSLNAGRYQLDLYTDA